MRTRAITLISMLTLMPISLGPAVAQEPHPNPNDLLKQWLEANTQQNIDAALRSAKEHAVKGEKDAAIADYRKVLSLAPDHPEAVAGLKALGLSDAAIASPPPKFSLPGGSSSTGSKNSSSPPATGGGGGGPLGDGLF